jgi:hypothetical protein
MSIVSLSSRGSLLFLGVLEVVGIVGEGLLSAHYHDFHFGTMGRNRY